MQADFAVELGADDEVLEIPWQGEGRTYCDLKRHPELLAQVEEARRVPELGQFLKTINSPAGRLETAKCDAWLSTDMNAEEEIFSATFKFCSYVDILFADEATRASFSEHEQFGKRVSDLLKRAPEVRASAEFLIRRCYYQKEKSQQEGLYVTYYLLGYGNDEAEARQRWAIGMKLAENAIRQLYGR
jgi:hypothetical protein